jgi:hypothetical protein
MGEYLRREYEHIFTLTWLQVLTDIMLHEMLIPLSGGLINIWH